MAGKHPLNVHRDVLHTFTARSRDGLMDDSAKCQQSEKQME